MLQILALDIGTDLLPALALGAEPPEPGVMERSPRTRAARSLDRAVLARAFGFLGPVEAVASLAMLPVGAALFLGWRPGASLPAGGAALAMLSTMVFAAIVLAQMANAFECRSTVASLRALGPATNRLLVSAVAVEFLALLGFVYLGPMQQLLGHQPLTPCRVGAGAGRPDAATRGRGDPQGGRPPSPEGDGRADRPGTAGPPDPEASSRRRLALAAEEDTGPMR